MGQVTKENMKDVLTYHAPTEDQLSKYRAIRNEAELFITTILNVCPPCADQTAAIRKVREAMMTANAAIALDGMV